MKMFSPLGILLTIKPALTVIPVYKDNIADIRDIVFSQNLQAAIHWVYCASDSHLSHRSDIPSAEGTESLIPYLRDQVDRY